MAPAGAKQARATVNVCKGRRKRLFVPMRSNATLNETASAFAQGAAVYDFFNRAAKVRLNFSTFGATTKAQ